VAGVLPALVAVVPLLVLLAGQVPLATDPAVPTADHALLELLTRSTLEGHNALGPYSRFGFRHPGGAMFVWMAPFYALARHNFGGMVIAMVAFHAVLVATAVVIVQRVFGRTSAWLAAIVALGFLGRFGLERFRDPWNPYWIVLPVAVVALAAVAAWHGRARWPAVVAVAAGTVAIQSHVGSALVIVVLAGVAVGGTIASWRGGGRRAVIRALVPAIVVGAVLWIPPLVQDPANLVHIARGLHTTDERSPGGGTAATLITAGLSWGPAPLGERFGPASPFAAPIELRPAELAVVVVMGLVLAGGAVAARRRREPVASVLVGAVPLLAAAVTFAAALRIRGEAYPYLFTSALGVSLLWWLGTAHYLARAVRAAVRRWVPGWASGLPRLAGPVALVACIGVLVRSAPQLERAAVPLARVQETPTTRDLLDAARPWCAHPVRIEHVDQDSWVEAVTVGDGLVRCGATVRFSEDLRGAVGDEYADGPGDRPADTVTLIVTRPDRPPAPGDSRLVVSGERALDRRPGPPAG
jgi:hypothetical protein